MSALSSLSSPCSQSAPDEAVDQVLIEADTGIVRAGQGVASLSPMEMEIFARLAEVRPRMLTKDALFDWLYQLDEDGGPDPTILRIYMSKIRRKIRPLGLEIETIWGRGWCFRCEHSVSIQRALKAPEVME